MKRALLTALAFVLSIVSLNAQKMQNFTIDNLDYTKYPIVRANLTAWDINGDVYYPQISEVNIRQGGFQGRVTDITCPPKPTQTLVQSSIILLIDKSGSMGVDRMNIAKSAALAFVDVISPNSEVAIMAFDAGVYNLQGFTSSKTLLRNAINRISAGGDTGFEQAINGYNGAISVLSTGRFSNKSIIFLTDGAATINANNTISNAKQINSTIYSLNIGQECPRDLQLISEGTGAKWFSNINDANQARQIYLNILRDVQNFQPCVITWEMDNAAPQRPLVIGIGNNEVVVADPPSPPPPSAEYVQYDCQYLNWFNYDRPSIKKVRDLRNRNISRADSVYIYGKVIEVSGEKVKLEIIDPGSNTEIYSNINDFSRANVQASRNDILVVLGKTNIPNINTVRGVFGGETTVINYDISPIHICNISKPQQGRNCTEYKTWVETTYISEGNKDKFNKMKYESRKQHIIESPQFTLTGFIKGKNFVSYLGGILTAGFYTSPIFSNSSFADTRIIGLPDRIFDTFINYNAKIIFSGRKVGYSVDGDNKLEDFEVQFENLIYIDR